MCAASSTVAVTGLEQSAASTPSTGSTPNSDERLGGKKHRAHRSKRPATASGPGNRATGLEAGVWPEVWPLGVSAELSTTTRVVPGSAGDHAAVHQFLMAVFHAPSREAFFSSLEDPFYEPNDRLLVKSGQRVLSHVHITRRVMHFDRLQFPVAGLCCLATLPEFRARGYARQLLERAEQAMVRDGAMLGLLKTKIPHFFRAAGWAVCGRHCHARARTRDLLASLPTGRNSPRERKALNIRPWRQVELPGLMRLYRQNTASAVGAYQRSEAYWRWLISRPVLDQIYVAVDGPGKFDLDAIDQPIVGYVMTKEDRVLELMAHPDHPAVKEKLLARACGDAIERDFHSIVLYAPPGDRLFEFFQMADAELHDGEAHQGEVFMAKIPDPIGFLHMICPELNRRAEATSLPQSCELGLHVEGQKILLALSRQDVKVSQGKLGRSYLRMNQAELTRLLLGHLDIEHVIAQQRVEASTRLAVEIAGVIFPRLPIWRPPLDDLME